MTEAGIGGLLEQNGAVGAILRVLKGFLGEMHPTPRKNGTNKGLKLQGVCRNYMLLSIISHRKSTGRRSTQEQVTKGLIGYAKELA